MPLQNADDFQDCSHDRLGTAPSYCRLSQCVVCNAHHGKRLSQPKTSLWYTVSQMIVSSNNGIPVKFSTEIGLLAQFITSYSTVQGPSNTWQWCCGLSGPECQPSIRSTFIGPEKLKRNLEIKKTWSWMHLRDWSSQSTYINLSTKITCNKTQY
jgi:hypothetical protein